MATEKRLIDANDAEKFAREHILDAKERFLILDFLRECSTVDAVEVVRARWVDNHCTACGMMPMGEELWKHMDTAPPRMEYFMDYCPCCGAKMDRG